MDRYLLIFFLGFILLAPHIILIPQVPALRPEDLILGIFLLKEALGYISKRNSFFLSSHHIKPLFFIGIAAVFSVLLQELVFLRMISFNDTMILPMIIKYILIYSLSYKVFSQGYIHSIVYLFLVFGVVSAIIGILQYHNILNVNSWLTPLYQPDETQIRGLLWQTIWARSIGTIGSPQKFGYLLIICTCFCLSHLIFGVKKLIFIPAICIFIIALIYTLSRTATLVLLINIVVIFFIYFSTLKNNLKFIQYSIITLILGIFVTNFFLTSGYKMRVLDSDSSSYRYSQHARVRDFKRPFIEIEKNPLYLFFGKGPSKNYIKTSLHNDYSWMLERYGIIALISYLALIIKAMQYSYKKYKITFIQSEKILLLGIFSVFLTFFFYAMAEDVFKGIKIMPVNMLFLGLLAAINKNNLFDQ
jgi:hypothetical protein